MLRCLLTCNVHGIKPDVLHNMFIFSAIMFANTTFKLFTSSLHSFYNRSSRRSGEEKSWKQEKCSKYGKKKEGRSKELHVL